MPRKGVNLSDEAKANNAYAIRRWQKANTDVLTIRVRKEQAAAYRELAKNKKTPLSKIIKDYLNSLLEQEKNEMTYNIDHSTVAEIIDRERENFTDFEVWKFKFSDTDHIHTDRIENIDSDHSFSCFSAAVPVGYAIMGESEYDSSVLANCGPSADFAEWYDDANAKVLVIMLPHDWEAKM